MGINTSLFCFLQDTCCNLGIGRMRYFWRQKMHLRFEIYISWKNKNKMLRGPQIASVPCRCGLWMMQLTIRSWSPHLLGKFYKLVQSSDSWHKKMMLESLNIPLRCYSQFMMRSIEYDGVDWCDEYDRVLIWPRHKLVQNQHYQYQNRRPLENHQSISRIE